MSFPTFLVALLVFFSTLIAAHAREKAIDERIAAFTAPLAESGYLSGCLLVSHGEQELARARYGYADAARSIENDFNTRFCIASLTKPITAVAIMRLVEQGAFELDDPVSRWNRRVVAHPAIPSGRHRRRHSQWQTE